MWVTSESSEEAIKKALGEPVFCGLSDRAWRARTQLLSVSILAIAIVWFRLKVNPEATLLGFSLTGMTDHAIIGGLIIALIYLFIHFVWLSWESFVEWKLRLTGTRVAFVTTGKFASEHGDYPADPQQSTLLNWWIQQAKTIGNLTNKIHEIQNTVNNFQSEITQACTTGDSLNIANATASLTGVTNALMQLEQRINDATKTLAAQRIPVSLDRFEKWFEHFLKTQNIRWLVIDVLLPVTIALVTLVSLIRNACWLGFFH